MMWNIEQKKTIGLGVNDHAREYSYAIVKATDKRETVLAVCPTEEEANRTFSNMRCLLNLEASEKKSSVPAKIILRRTMKFGSILNKDMSNPRIRWDYQETKTQRIKDVKPYSMKHAKKLVKRNL